MSAEQKEEKASLEDLKKEVVDAKIELLLLAKNVDPLRPLRKHPVATVGCALAGGVLMGLCRKVKLAPFLPIALEAGELLLKRANARFD